MPSWGDLLGSGSVAEQLIVWGVLNQLLGDLFVPFLELVRQRVLSAAPVMVESPEELADMVVRGIRSQAAAASDALKSGINGERFADMVHGAGEPPGLETVLEMYRRKIIGLADTGLDAPSVERAIKTSRIYDYWSDALVANSQVPISVGEAVDALLRGQTDEATAMAEAEANGINPERFKILVDSAGRPPSPMELVELLRRKLIPLEGVGPGVVSFQQGIFEGDAKDKWWPRYADLAVYIPPPRTVTALVRTGSLTDEQAVGYWTDAGLSPALAAAYLHSAKGEKLAGSKQLAEQTILTLYESHAIEATAAARHLAAVGYGPEDVALLLGLADLRRELAQVNAAVTRIRTLYVGHKITRQAASAGLAAVDLAQAHIDHLLGVWDVEEAANVRQLTPAQILKAYKLGNISEGEALAELRAVGYTPRDAQILAWNELGTASKTPPPQGPAGPGTVP